ncbi:ccr4 associated factor [Thelotrema lepadinum]|nr:ccr4 associated factor [Thelotrema lepadinum]
MLPSRIWRVGSQIRRPSLRRSRYYCYSTSSRLRSQHRTDIPSWTEAGHTILPSRSLIELRGHDAAQFLQGLTTTNIPNGVPQQTIGLYSAFLNAQGRLLQDVFIYPLRSPISSSGDTKLENGTEPTYLIEVDTSQKDNLARWLRKYKLRSKVSIRQIPSDEMAVSSVWDDSVSPDELKGTVDEWAHQTNSVCTIDNRAPGLGLRLLHRVEDGFLGRPSVDSSQYALRRYLHGVPEGQSELGHESALVHESCIDYMGGVDFRKGCYVGQELVIRTQHTGVVRKRILPCVLYDAANDPPATLTSAAVGGQLQVLAEDIPSGADVRSVAGKEIKARSKGKWMTGVGNVGLAICRLEDVVGLGPMGERVETWDSKMQWCLDWKSDDAESRDIRLKAFIPDWWAQRRVAINNS